MKDLNRKEKMRAFTLAEVLITLAVIGVVAAMAIPVLNIRIQKNTAYNKYNKALSVIAQASSLIRKENGGSMANLATTHLELANLFKPQLNTLVFCEDQNDVENCYLPASEQTYNLHGTAYGTYSPYGQSDYAKIVTSDGFVYMFKHKSSDCSADTYMRNGINESCAVVIVDINGIKKPNTFGKDLFNISVNKYNTTPYINMPVNIAENTKYYNCDETKTRDWNGADCGYRVIIEGGINYY